jgi:hypothetical protein
MYGNFNLLHGILGQMDGGAYEPLLHHLPTLQAALPRLVQDKLGLDYTNHDMSYDFLNPNTLNAFANSYLSVVTETLWTTVDRAFTEKTLKAILYRHPFIVIGSPGLLAYLRDLGFQTFGNWIDESYDAVIERPERTRRALDEVERLCRLSDGAMRALYAEMTAVLEHNHAHLLDNHSRIAPALARLRDRIQ